MRNGFCRSHPFPPDRQFILLGSSARKLKRGGAALLAGRAVQRLLFPFTLAELGEHFNLGDALRFGTLPPLFGLNDAEKQDTLNAYTETYLREEIQMEGFVRNLGGFSGLRAFRNDNPAVPLSVVYRGTQTYRTDDIRMIPWRTFLDKARQDLAEENIRICEDFKFSDAENLPGVAP